MPPPDPKKPPQATDPPAPQQPTTGLAEHYRLQGGGSIGLVPGATPAQRAQVARRRRLLGQPPPAPQQPTTEPEKPPQATTPPAPQKSLADRSAESLAALAATTRLQREGASPTDPAYTAGARRWLAERGTPVPEFGPPPTRPRIDEGTVLRTVPTRQMGPPLLVPEPATRQMGPPLLAPEPGRLERSIYERQLSLLQPEFDRAQQALAVMLSQRGIPIDSTAATSALDRLGTQQEEARSRLAQAAVGAGLDELRAQQVLALQSRAQAWNQALQGGQFGLQSRIAAHEMGLSSRAQAEREAARRWSESLAARQQGLSEMMLERQTPFQELLALIHGQPLPTMPTFPTRASVSVNAPGFLEAMQKYEAAQAAAGGGLF